MVRREQELAPRARGKGDGLIYLASLLGFGDALVSLSLLEKIRPAKPDQVVVLGTGLTSAVLGTLKHPPWWKQRELFGGIPGFYELRTQSPLSAVRDLAFLSRLLRNTLNESDQLLLEKQDWRSSLLSVGNKGIVVTPRGTSAYQARKEMLEMVFSSSITLPHCQKPAIRPKKVLINPSARQAVRCFSGELLKVLLGFFSTKGCEVTLLDPTGQYEAFAERSAAYMRAPSLASAARAVRESDFYVGPDSFFLHLAYYYDKPFFTFFLPGWFYFAPPGTLDLGNYAISEPSMDLKLVIFKLEKVFH